MEREREGGKATGIYIYRERDLEKQREGDKERKREKHREAKR